MHGGQHPAMYNLTRNITTMKTYSFMGKQCAIHIHAENKKEAVKKLQEQGEAANMKNVYLLDFARLLINH